MTNFKSVAGLLLCAATSLTVAGCAGGEYPQQGATAEAEAPPVEMVAWKGVPRPEIAEILQAHPDGLQIAENKVAFDNGKVVLTLPDENGESTAAGDQSPGPTLLSFSSSVHGCPNGWYCFYENDKFRGRRLQFRDCSSGGTTQSLANYGFDNQTTSWLVNRSVGSIEVYHVTVAKNGSGVTELWREEAYSSSSNVGTANNDKADSFTCWL